MGDMTKNTILIIDDEKPNLMYLNNLLCTDYSVFIARNGMEALKSAHKLMPDLILLDIIMPIMNGYEVLSELKASEATKDIPVIFTTGLCSNEDEERGLALGTADYITKPFSSTIVKLRVGNQIRIINQMRAIERLSMTDQLTGIANRRCFDQRLLAEWQRAVREKSPISIMMLDVDRFKSYNDTYGHQKGDAVLQEVAKMLTNSMKRPADLVARWGGEEFVALLPTTSAEGAVKVAEQIRAKVEESKVPCFDGNTASVTISIGLYSLVPTQNSSMNDFISKADTALYDAKKKGRNRVCSACSA